MSCTDDATARARREPTRTRPASLEHAKLRELGKTTKQLAELSDTITRDTPPGVSPTASLRFGPVDDAPPGPATVAALRDELLVQPVLARIEQLGGALALDRDRVMTKRVHPQIKALLATNWQGARFSGEFTAGAADDLVMVERELIADIGYGFRVARSDGGAYTYFIKQDDAQQVVLPVYRFRTAIGDQNIMGAIEFEPVAPTLLGFLERLRPAS
ncbi:MAG: hypothetical protein H6713_40090 [Myxococcales bacterium]|nr:hypothetical protein [Myxococcales bacterium]MCB9756162.1 hypothetical protein [Myxococcales bacterium]